MHGVASLFQQSIIPEQMLGKALHTDIEFGDLLVSICFLAASDVSNSYRIESSWRARNAAVRTVPTLKSDHVYSIPGS